MGKLRLGLSNRSNQLSLTGGENKERSITKEDHKHTNQGKENYQ
jgi:hypothetical protein